MEPAVSPAPSPRSVATSAARDAETADAAELPRVKSTYVIPWKEMDPEIEAARIKDELRHMTSADFFMQTLNKEWRVQDAKVKAQQIAAERQSRRLVRGLPVAV